LCRTFAFASPPPRTTAPLHTPPTTPPPHRTNRKHPHHNTHKTTQLPRPRTPPPHPPHPPPLHTPPRSRPQPAQQLRETQTVNKNLHPDPPLPPLPPTPPWELLLSVHRPSIFYLFAASRDYFCHACCASCLNFGASIFCVIKGGAAKVWFACNFLVYRHSGAGYFLRTKLPLRGFLGLFDYKDTGFSSTRTLFTLAALAGSFSPEPRRRICISLSQLNVRRSAGKRWACFLCRFRFAIAEFFDFWAIVAKEWHTHPPRRPHPAPHPPHPRPTQTPPSLPHESTQFTKQQSEPAKTNPPPSPLTPLPPPPPPTTPPPHTPQSKRESGRLFFFG